MLCQAQAVIIPGQGAQAAGLNAQDLQLGHGGAGCDGAGRPFIAVPGACALFWLQSCVLSGLFWQTVLSHRQSFLWAGGAGSGCLGSALAVPH